MKLLTFDIETSPNLAMVWGLFNQNVSLSQLRETTEVMSWAAKWYGERTVHSADWRDPDYMVQFWKLLDEADAVVTYNGNSFDIKHVQRHFVEHGMGKPSPYAKIDLLAVVRKNFRFTSNKLDHVCEKLIGKKKTPHTGFQLWLDCIAGDEKAWNLMNKYCRNDVVITEKLYTKLLGWIDPHPSVPLRDGKTEGCPNCGGFSRQQRGYACTATRRYLQYRCNGCGRWYRGAQMVASTDAR